MEIDAAFPVFLSNELKVVNVCQNVGVSHNDALRPTGCATCVDEGQNCFRVVNRIRTGVVPNVPGLFIEHDLPRRL